MAQRRVLQLLPRLHAIMRLQGVCNHSITQVVCTRQTPVGAATLQRCLHTTSTLANEFIINIQDEEDFKDRVTDNVAPVVVDFHAQWCGPCKILGPRLESLISSKDGKVILAKVDIDDNTDLAMEHGVQAVPTVLGMKGGKVIDKFVGVKDEDELESFVKKITGE